MPFPPKRRRWLVPDGVDTSAWRLLAARAMRAFADGYMALLLPAYLLALGLGTFEVGVLATTTLLGSALSTMAVGAWGHRIAPGRLLAAAVRSPKALPGLIRLGILGHRAASALALCLDACVVRLARDAPISECRIRRAGFTNQSAI